MRNISMKSFCIQTRDSGGDISYLELLRASCLAGLNRLVNFGRGGIIRSISVNLFLNRTVGSEDIVLRYFLFISLVTILFGGAEPFGLFWQTALWPNIWCQWSKIVRPVGVHYNHLRESI